MYVLNNAAAFNEACAGVNRTVDIKCDVTVDGTTNTMVGGGSTGEIVSFEWDNIICSNDGIQIGTTCMDEFKMTYRYVSTSVPVGAVLKPYIGIDISGTVTYVPLGIFHVTNVETEDDGATYDITAYDGMVNTIVEFDPDVLGITFPVNAWTLLSAIASHLNVSIVYDVEVLRLLSSEPYVLTTSDNKTLIVYEDIEANARTKLPEALEGTLRDYIGWIAGLVGANAHFDRDGNLAIIRYTDHGYSISRDVQYLAGTKIKYNGAVQYGTIVSGTEEDPVYPTGYTGNAITYSNPFINSTELTTVCDYVIGSGITVTPCDVQWRSNPCIDAGDIVSVIDKNGNSLPVFVMERVVKVTGGLEEELYCYAETETQKVLNQSPTVKKLTQVSKAAESAADYINNTQGTFQYIDNGDGTNGGFKIYEAGGQAFLRCTAGGIGLSQDGGLTYTNAITKAGVTATQLDVRRNGVRLGYLGYSSNTPIFYFYNPNGAKTFGLFSSPAANVQDSEYRSFLRFYAGQTAGNEIAALEISTNHNYGSGETLGASLVLKDITYNRPAIQLFANRSSGANMNESFSFSNAKTGQTSIYISSAYNQNNSNQNNSLTIYDNEGNATVALYVSNTTGGKTAVIGIKDEDYNDVITMKTVNDEPVLIVKSPTYGTKNLYLLPITISNRTYYVLGSA